jgi:hypothetical protein
MLAFAQETYKNIVHPVYFQGGLTRENAYVGMKGNWHVVRGNTKWYHTSPSSPDLYQRGEAASILPFAMCE